MAQFLFVVDIPPYEHPAIGVQTNVGEQWRRFESDSRSIKLPSSSSKQLFRNVWLLDAKNSLPTLLELSALADTCKLQYSAFLVDGEMTPLTKK